MAKRKWSELSPSVRKVIVVAGLIELVLTAVVLRDLAKRPASAVRGPKAAWRVASFVQPFGPIAYLMTGRRD